jgi:hypothetical protein
MPVNVKKPLCVFGTCSATVFLFHTHQTVPLTHQILPKVKKPLFVIEPTVQRSLDKSRFKGEKLNRSRTYQRQKTAVCDLKPTYPAVFWIHTQAVIIKRMATSHFIGENFASDIPKDFEADTEDKIVIDKLLVNKLTLAVDKFYLQRSR